MIARLKKQRCGLGPFGGVRGVRSYCFIMGMLVPLAYTARKQVSP